jgi:hypothetical protein
MRNLGKVVKKDKIQGRRTSNEFIYKMVSPRRLLENFQQLSRLVRKDKKIKINIIISVLREDDEMKVLPNHKNCYPR